MKKICKGGKIVIIETSVKMVINQYNIDYYKSKGYEVVLGQRIMIDIKDLPPTSGVKIHTKCEFCGCIFEKAYRRYVETVGKICCKACRKKKVLENTFSKYGVTSTLKLPEIRQKAIDSNMRKYGVEFPLLSEDIRKMASDTMTLRYGHPYTLQNEKLREKCNKTMFDNGNGQVYTSKQQKYLCELYDGILNFPIGKYSADIFIESISMCIEYNGSGHALSVKMGKETIEHFEMKENERDAFIINSGYKILKLVSTTDILPNESKLLEIKDECISKMMTNNYSICEYNIDTFTESFK